MIEHIFSLVAYVFLGVFAVISVFNGTQRLVVHDRPKGAAISLMLGVLIFASYSGLNFIKYKTVTQTVDTLAKAKIKIPPEREWYKDLTPERREAIREMKARMTFFDSGELMSYSDKDGKKKIFTPTQIEIQSREEMSLKAAELNELGYERYFDIFRGALVGIFAAMLGLSAGRRSRAEAANSMMDTDANMRRSSSS